MKVDWGYLRNRMEEKLPTGSHLYSLLAIGISIAVVLGEILFIQTSILPQWRLREKLEEEGKQLLETRPNQSKSPEQWKEKLATAQANLNQTASVFFSESEAAEVLNNIYKYANESNVDIVSLQNQPGPKQEKKEVYDVKVFQLQAVGTVSNLIDFVSWIKETAFRSFIINNVYLVEDESHYTLTLDIMLYTSPYSSGVAIGSSTDVTSPASSENLAQLEKAVGKAWALNSWERVISLLRQIAAIDPEYNDVEGRLYTAYANYGYQLLKKGNADVATMQFKLALEIKPDGEMALAGIRQAVATPTPTLTAEEQLARRLDAARAEENWEEVISLLERIKAINPAYKDLTEKRYAAHVDYGYALAAEERLEKAMKEFSHALAVKPDGEEAVAGLQKVVDKMPTPLSISQSEYTTYVVQRGDNLYSIALHFDTSVQAIMEANGLTNHNIRVGQRLKIPTS